MRKRYVITDTETGGLDPRVSGILTLYAAVVEYDDESQKFIFQGDIGLKVRPHEEAEITAEAIKVNGINLKEHYSSEETLTEEDAANALHEWTAKHNARWLPVIGQNVTFDMNFISEMCRREGLKSPFYHRTLDTMSIWLFLHASNVIPDFKYMRLQNMCEYYGIEYVDAHDAKKDCELTLRVLEEMIKQVKDGS